MRSSGAIVVETEYVEAINGLGEAEFTVLQYEFRETLNSYLRGVRGPVRSLKDVIEFNKKNADVMMPYFGQDVLESSETKVGLDSKEYLDALRKSRDGSREILNKVMEADHLDALCGITAGPPCSTDVIYGDQWGNVSSTTPAAISGYPHVSVPSGMVHGLPVGLSFFGLPYTEPLLIGIAHAYEQLSAKRVPPRFETRYEGS
jgi:amidase